MGCCFGVNNVDINVDESLININEESLKTMKGI